MSWTTTAFPVATLLVGFGANYFGDWGKDRRAATRERVAREHDKANSREAFELATLGDCSRALSELTGMVFGDFFDALNVIIRTETAPIGDTPFRPKEDLAKYSDDIPSLTRDLERLQDLILSAATRQQVRAASQSLTTIRSFSGTVDDAIRNFGGVSRVVTVAQAAIADRTRLIYGGDQP